jgi:hypothetical protein
MVMGSRLATRRGNGLQEDLLVDMPMKTLLPGCLALILGTAPAQRVEAQVQASSLLAGISVGAGLDRFVYEGTGATAFTYRRSSLRPGRLGPS